MLQEKNNLSTEQITKECICSECTEWSTAFLAELGKSVIRTMYSISILVVLAMSSLIVNSLASGVVIQPARALENNICCPSLQKCTVEIVCIFLESIVLISVTTIRVKKPQDTDGQETPDGICDC